MKKTVIALCLVAVAGAGGAWYWEKQNGTGTTFRVEEAAHGKLVATVGATGTLQPRELVDVGAQVQGQIITIGKDPATDSGIVTWGSEVQGPVLDKDGNVVKSGTVLAQIDPSIYDAQRSSGQAAVRSAEAALKSAKADVLVKTATLSQATKDWGRAQKLYTGGNGGLANGGIAQAEYDQYKSQFDSATANLEVAKAAVGTAEAQIAAATANLKTAQTNLNYTTITAPVTGTVIDRRVNVGQTVVASLSAPSLFLIAKDLKKMEVWATVNEVDIGRIHTGDPVNFTVDSNPTRVYHGKVVPQGKFPLRFNVQMISNVVTYTVVVSAENEDLSLRPYQTANLSFIVADKKDALLVPNAALRWLPAKEQIAPDQRAAYYQLKGKKHAPTDPDAQDHGLVWTQGDDGFVRYAEVRTGLSDGVKTEVLEVIGGELPDHTRLVVGEEKKGAQGGEKNPFSVQMFRGNKSKDKDKE
ncbi:MAG TPA: HlyD family efflux transporter periplasmic adaptor subunit [Gemmataceae bacterium]|nr:HlyD family efflux transporter periplasmic adaptor subunit [Gemmataceae bacterium]